jgi:CheY-like chemotaxis protein
MYFSMPKLVLDVGNCFFDHSEIRRVVRKHFDADVELAVDASEALGKLREQSFDLVLINRKLHGQGDGIELIRQIRSDAALAETPAMLMSNYEEYQQKAIEAGAAPGFGKSELDSEETRQKLATFLQ